MTSISDSFRRPLIAALSRFANFNVSDSNIHYRDSWTRLKTEWDMGGVRCDQPTINRTDLLIAANSFEKSSLPSAGALALSTDRGRRAYRWLFNALHSFDFPALLSNRPAWHAVVWLLSILGMVISVSGIVIGWQYLRRSACLSSPRRRLTWLTPKPRQPAHPGGSPPDG
jgi:hypothetical protein